MYKLAKMLKCRKGFTLVELMVVVVIIGLLIAIAVPIFNAVTERAEAKACQTNQRILDGAVMMWSTEEGVTVPEGGLTFNNIKDYVQEEPFCPTNNKPYQIKSPGTSHVCPDSLGKHARPTVTAPTAPSTPS